MGDEEKRDRKEFGKRERERGDEAKRREGGEKKEGIKSNGLRK